MQFTTEELKRIEIAVGEAERKTSGEIVPYFVDRSDAYEDTFWKGGFFFTVAGLALLTVVRTIESLWLPYGVMEVVLLSLFSGGIGYLLTRFVEPILRFFAGKELLALRVSQRASEAFLTEEVFSTRERTGILIFVSRLERRVHVLGDSGINRKLAADDWDGVVKIIVESIRSGHAADGIVEAVAECGRLLEKAGVARRKDDTDELPNNLRKG